MEYQKQAHGEFECDTALTQERILVCRFIGPWNLETAQSSVSEVLKHAEQFKPHSWG